MVRIIRGKEMAEEIREDLKKQAQEIMENHGKLPGLAVIQVGDDPASAVYVNNKKKACEGAGFRSFGYHLAAETSQEELLALVNSLNENEEVHGILCQLPLPKHMNEFEVLCAVSPAKDVDGFHPYNVGLLSIGRKTLVSCTPAGVLEMLLQSDVDISGKECVIIGRSNIVGKPVYQLMLAKNATVTTCHSRTANIKEVCKRADILIVAIGKAKFVTKEFVKEGAVVIDVGINRDENGKLCGDCDFDSVCEVAGAVSPVPNGVGPMTIAMLLKNTLLAFREIEDIH